MKKNQMKEKMMSQLDDLVQHALDQDYNKANKIFGDMMSVKLNDVLDQEKMKIADQVYNGVEEDDEEQLELDLEDEDEEDSGDGDGAEDIPAGTSSEGEAEGVQEPGDVLEVEVGDEDDEQDET